MREKILKAAHLSGEGHVPSALSILDLLYVFFITYPERMGLVAQRDFDFLLSKGHASLGLYAVLEEAKFIEDDWVQEFCKSGSDYGGHPDRLKIPGVIASTGSLGHGLPISVGRALGYFKSGERRQVFCLIGDGELNEGSNWECFVLMEQFELSNLTVIIDLNYSTDRAISIESIDKKLEKFDFAIHIIDGHDHNQIISAIQFSSTRPKVIIAHTVKGKGISEMENNHAWHHKSPNESQLNHFLERLKQ